jgi:hypothetical protein
MLQLYGLQLLLVVPALDLVLGLGLALLLLLS